jgi:hypothetical protein
VTLSARSWCALLCVTLASALQGCILTRVLETKTQLCDDQPSRIVVSSRPGDGIRVVFDKPTLTDRDVIWIVGYEPTEITRTDAARAFSYEALPVHRPLDRATGLAVRLSFARLEGEYRLSEVEIPERFASVLSPPTLDAAIRVVCKAQIGVVPPSTTFDLTSLDRSALPTRRALTQLLGAPTATIAQSDEVLYQYCLAPCDPKSSMVASFKLLFGIDGQLRRADASYFRYFVAVDLISSKATATIELH